MSVAVPETTDADFRHIPYFDRLPVRNKIGRLAWAFVYVSLFRPSPSPLHGWRRFLLRCFGAHLSSKAHVYPRARIWAPWNLIMGRNSCLANDVDCYSVAEIKIGDYVTISQYAMLCAATHDYESPGFELLPKSIQIHNGAWVAARALVGPGVVIGEGAVVGAASSVFKNVAPWTVVGGNPARVIKRRVMR